MGQAPNLYIGDFIKHFWKHWDEWNIQVLVFASFVLQIILTFIGNLRRYTPGICVRFITWCSYLLSGFVATVALGKLTEIEFMNKTNVQKQPDDNQDKQLMALLAPLLFLHIGNPDCLTAYSMEDNQLGPRQFLSLLFQLGTVVLILSRNWFKCELSYLYLCRGLFFQSTMDQIQHLSDTPGVQSPTTLVIHSRRNMRKNSPKAIHRAQSPKEERKAQPTCSSNSSLPHKGILKYFENERENGLQASFFPPPLARCSRR